MALVIPENHWQCKLRWRLSGDPEEMISTIGVVGNDPGPRDILQVAEAVYIAWEGSFDAASLNQAWQFIGVDVTEGGETEDPQVGSYDRLQQGTGTWASLPHNCALLAKKKSAKGGRRNSGRMFIPAGYIGELEVGGNGVLSTVFMNGAQAKFTNFYDSLRDTLTAVGMPIADFKPVIFHSSLPSEPTEITSLVVDSLIATQRRRMRR